MSDVLIAEAELGEEARRFMESDLYRCMVGMAEQEVLAAHELLETHDPSDVEGIRKLQNQAARGRSFKGWLVELVDKGNTALEVFKQQTSN